MGRFVGRSYRGQSKGFFLWTSHAPPFLVFRQPVTAFPGTSLVEIFVLKETDEKYVMQVLYRSGLLVAYLILLGFTCE